MRMHGALTLQTLDTTEVITNPNTRELQCTDLVAKIRRWLCRRESLWLPIVCSFPLGLHVDVHRDLCEGHIFRQFLLKTM